MIPMYTVHTHTHTHTHACAHARTRPHSQIVFDSGNMHKEWDEFHDILPLSAVNTYVLANFNWNFVSRVS